MSDRQKIISRLIADREFRADYIRAKLEVIIPSQLRALRLRQEKKQAELAELADMKQARISAMETPGRVNFNLETLVRMAATHNVGLVVKFVAFSEMLDWENSYSQDAFNTTRLADDIDFLQPAASTARKRARRKRSSRRALFGVRIAQTPVTAAVMGASAYMNPVQRGRVQMRLQFESSEQAPPQTQIADVIDWPNPSGSVNDLDVLKQATAAGAGAGTWRNYGT
jgi:transcriptional regulator with XRE-family HTH domain